MFVQLADDEWVNLSLVERVRVYSGQEVCLVFTSGRTVCYDGESMDAVLTSLENAQVLDKSKLEG